MLIKYFFVNTEQQKHTEFKTNKPYLMYKEETKIEKSYGGVT